MEVYSFSPGKIYDISMVSKINTDPYTLLLKSLGSVNVLIVFKSLMLINAVFVINNTVKQ